MKKSKSRKPARSIDVSDPPDGNPMVSKKKYAGGKRRSLNAPDWYGDAVKATQAAFKSFSDIVKRPGATMLMESMFESDPAKCPVWTDPQTKMEVHARVVKVKWLERYIGKGNKEAVRKVTYTPAQFRETMNTTKKNLREAAKSKKFTEAQRDAIEQLREDFEGDGFGNWPTAFPGGGFPGGDYLPFPPGPLTRNMYLNDQWEMIAQSHQLYNHNATAHGAVNMLAAFVVGDGVGIKSEDDAVQGVIDEFINRVKFQPRLFTQSVMLSKNGELLWHFPAVKVENQAGFTDFISKDPGTCWEKITNLDDERDVKAYYFNYPTRYLIVTKDDLPVSDYIVEFIDPAEMIHIKVNVEENEARGRSDLLSIQPLLKMVYDNLRYRNIKVMNAAGIIINRTILGDASDVSSVSSIQTGFTGAGTEYTHNESEKLEILKGAESENAKSGLHDETMSQVGTGFGEPADYLGTGGSGSRAGALTRTEPGAKLFLARQVLLETPIKDGMKIVIQNAKLAGRLAADAPEEVEVSFPEVAPENGKDKIGILNICRQTFAITHEEYVGLVRTEIKLNKTWAYDALQAKIAQEKRGLVASLYQAPTVDPDTGAVTDTPLGGPAAPKGPPGTNQPNPNVQGKNQSRTAYKGKMGLTNQDRNTITKQLQAMREGKKKPGGKGEHKGLTHISKGLKSRTKHTVEAGAAYGALLRQGTKTFGPEAFTKEWEALKKSPSFKELVMATESEVAPAGWKDTVHAMLDHPEIDNPYALAYWMDANGYTPQK